MSKLDEICHGSSDWFCTSCGSEYITEAAAKNCCCGRDSVSPLQTQIGGDHYKNFAIQPAEFSTRNRLGFLEGCVIKRVCRHRNKNGRQDLEKAIHELQLLIELEYPE